jgi:hypothetical protein
MTKQAETYEGLELVKTIEPSTEIGFTLRLYRTPIDPDVGRGYRYHFGFPAEMVGPLAVVLEAPGGWNRRHWTEDEGFWIWSLPVTGTKPPRAQLNRELRAMVAKFNRFAKATKKILGRNPP